MKYDILHIIRLVIIGLVTALLYFVLIWSCSGCAVHKNVAKVTFTEQKKSDSLTTTKVDSSASHSTITIKDDNGTFDKETIFEFSNAVKTGDLLPEKLNSLPTDLSKVDLSNIVKITVREKGVNKIHEVKLSHDTISKKAEVVTKVVKEDAVKIQTLNKVVKRTSYWWLLWFLLLIPAYLVYKNWNKIKLLFP